MKVLSLWPPYAMGIARGHKQWETRSWSTSYRGLLGIHATATMPKQAWKFCATEYAVGRIPKQLPLGAILCIVRLVEVVSTLDAERQISAIEKLYGDYSVGRYAWKLELVMVFDAPIPCRGHQGLWECAMSELTNVDA